MGRTTQSQSPTGSPTRSRGDESAAKDKARIAKLKEAGKEAGASVHLVRHFIATGASVENAQKAFDELKAKGSWSDKNLATFHQVKETPKP